MIKNNYITKEFLESILSNGEGCQYKIAESVGMTKESFKYFLKKFKIDFKNFTSFRYGMKVDESYFNCIDTIDKAYFLGLLYADGHITTHLKSFSITLAETDRYILDVFKKCLKSEHNIRQRKRYSENHQYQFQLEVGSKKIVKSLAILGMHPRKSLTCEFPSFDQVPKKFMWHFIRGYFCGDGCISWTKSEGVSSSRAFMCVSEPFGLKLKSFIKEELGMELHFRYQKNNKICILEACGRRNTIKFLDAVYENSEGFRLERKYNKYIEAKNFKKKYPKCGVSFHKASGKFYTYFDLNRKRHHIGYFKTSEEAYEAFDSYLAARGLPNPNHIN